MIDSNKVYASWSKAYMNALLEGYLALPDEIRKLPIEEQAGILRGMMVEAGKSGLVPTAAEVIKMLEAEAPKEEQKSPTGSAASSAQPAKPAEEKPKDLPKTPNENKPNAVPESVPGEWPYDKDHMHWNFCAVCHNRDIDQVSEKSQRPYQACVPCKVYLNADGKAVRIGSGERVKAVGKPGERWTWVRVEA